MRVCIYNIYIYMYIYIYKTYTERNRVNINKNLLSIAWRDTRAHTHVLTRTTRT